MFESLKKKFADTTGKLRNKVEDEAKEENNVELIEESVEETFDEMEETEIGEEISEEVVEDEVAEEETIDEDEISEDELDEILDATLKEEEEESEEETDEGKKGKSGFFSFLKRDKKDDSKEEASDDESADESELEEEVAEQEVVEEETIAEAEGSIEDESVAEEAEDADEESESDEEEPKKSKRSLFRRKKKEESEESKEEKSGGFLSFIKEKSISEDDVEDILFELELGLLESDVAMDVSSVVVESVKNDLVGQKIKRSSDIEEYTYEALKNAVAKILNVEGKSMTELLEEKVAQGEPLVVMLVGINGTGKTTTIGKLSNYYIKKGYTPVIAASDTFRAGAIEQVAYHADNLGVKLIKHEKGSDPAAVAFDAVQHAKAKGKELVLIDTAGRMQTNTNLMDEMKKIRRVSKPDLVVFVGDALTGNDATEQARKFNEAIDIDGVILTKADADSKGGAALSVGYIIKKPIFFLGMGQSYDDIKEYDADWMLEQIFS